jgi:hypothetical protein
MPVLYDCGFRSPVSVKCASPFVVQFSFSICRRLYSGSIKCWELPRGCTSCGLSSGTQLHRVSSFQRVLYISIGVGRAWYVLCLGGRVVDRV